MSLMDPGAHVNCITETLAKEWDLEPTDEPPLRASGFNKAKSVSINTYRIATKIRDNKGTAYESKQLFYSFQELAYPILMGLPWMMEANPQVNWNSMTWRYTISNERLTLDTPEDFMNAMGDEDAVYALVCSIVPCEEKDQEIPVEISAHKELFNKKSAKGLPTHKEHDHAIDIMPGKTPPYGPLYNMSPKELVVLREYIRENLALGRIRHSVADAGAPVLFMPKKDGGLRLCVDYRGLNAVTIKNRVPLPLIDETLDRLVGAAYFTKLDLKEAYHRIRIKYGDEWKTAFRTRYGLFEYAVMPFGLANAPATFQALMNKVLGGLVDIICVVFLDDILIYSQTQEEHWERVNTVLERLRKYDLYVNLAKCRFMVTSVEFLGYVISNHGISMDPSRVEAIKSWPTPNNLRELQVFLGFANFYRRFIVRYAKVSRPLSELLKGSKNGKQVGDFIWSAEAAQAFTELIGMFTSAPILVHFDPNGKILVETDASGFAIAAIISQFVKSMEHDGQPRWHPIAFYSRKMIPAETRYPTHDQELLAVVEAFKQWRHYLEGSQFTVTVVSDHNNLRYFMSTTTLNRRQARWALLLGEYDFEIKYRAGTLNPADGPSRRPDYEGEQLDDTCLPTLQRKLRNVAVASMNLDHEEDRSWAEEMSEDELPDIDSQVVDDAEKQTMRREEARQLCENENPYEDPSKLLLEKIGEIQKEDKECILRRKLLREKAQEKTSKSNESAGKPQESSEKVKDKSEKTKEKPEETAGNPNASPGMYDRGWSLDRNNILRYFHAIYVPREAALKAEILKRCHDDPLAGHFGYKKTIDFVQRKFYWPYMRKDIEEYVKGCAVCQRTKAHHHRPYGDLTKLPTPSRPFEEITMDMITELPPSKWHKCVYDATLVVVDRYTRFAIYIPILMTMTAEQMGELLMEHVFLKYGPPKGIVTDRGSLFTSNYWSAICHYLKVKRRLSTAFHPQSDGQTERQNQTLEHYLRCFINFKQDNWASLLALAQFVYNCAKHASTNISPFESLMGYNPDFLWQLDNEDADIPAARDRVQKLWDNRAKLEQSLQAAATSQAKWANKKLKPMGFKVGDEVMLSTKNIKQVRPKKKFADKYTGPFKVEGIVGLQAYRLILPVKWRIHPVFHVSLLEKYHENSTTPIPSEVELLDDGEEWEIEEILAEKKGKKAPKYLVRWKGFAPCEDQWVAEKDLGNAEEALQTFKRKRGETVSTKPDRKKAKTMPERPAHRAKRAGLRSRKGDD